MFVITKQVATDLAKALRREAAARGVALGHSSSLDRTARALGFRDFNGLAAAMKAAPVQLEPEGDGGGHLPLFHMMSRHSSECAFRVVGGPSSDGAAVPRFRTAREMAAAWLGADGGADRDAAVTTLALALVGALLPSWQTAPATPATGPSAASGLPATIRTDDGMREADFDASGYFGQASDEELWELRSIGFRGDYQADAVAWHVHGEPGFEDVTAVLDYDQEVARCGFEVVVDPDAAMAWIAANRPALHASLAAGGAEGGEAPTPA